MSSDNGAISVRGLSKSYRLFSHPGDRLKQFLSLGLRRYHREFMALRDVSFDIGRGEAVGIIGPNGSGKSTLLQLICGILKPTRGEVRVNGRVSALLELGAGFNPEFTGRENVYFHGALMGLTKAQVDERFDRVAAFADIGDFIDEPVRVYSSGMFVRLAFSSAIHVDPDILLVDEALAVGDRAFQERCFARMAEIRSSGGAIVFVTHVLDQVAHFCSRALLLEGGTIRAEGKPDSVLRQYLDHAGRKGDNPAGGSTHTVIPVTREKDRVDQLVSYNPDEVRVGCGAAAIYQISVEQGGFDDPVAIIPGVALRIVYRIRFDSGVPRPIYGLVLKASDAGIVFSTNSKELLAGDAAEARAAGDRVEVTYEICPFLECGEYFVTVGVSAETDSGIRPLDRRYDVLRLRVEIPRDARGQVDLRPTLSVKPVGVEPGRETDRAIFRSDPE